MNHAPIIHCIAEPADTCRFVADVAAIANLEHCVHPGAVQALQHVGDDDPGCLVTDLHLADMNCFDVQEELNRRTLSLPMIVVTGGASIRAAVQAIKAGIFDFLEKPVAPAALIAAIHAALAQQASLRRQHLLRRDVLHRLRTLTRRERQVLALVVAGRLNKEIALDLGISPKTVEIHRANLMKKMEAQHMTDLVRMSLAAGIAPPRLLRDPAARAGRQSTETTPQWVSA